MYVDTISPLDAAVEVLKPGLLSSDTSSRVISAKCLGLMAGYHHRWHDAPYRIEAVESTVTADLFNPNTNARSRTFTVAGKIDVIATEMSTGRRILFDHKTTSEDITDPNAPYWRQLVVEGQPPHYMLLEWLNGHKVDLAIWDAIRKPAIRPSKIAKKERERIIFCGNYFGQTLSQHDVDEFFASEQETPFMYAARLAQDTCTERPEWYFQRRPVPRMDSEILEYSKELWQHSQDIILSRRQESHPRNSGACMLYRSPCKFLGICSGHDSPDSGNWSKRETVHPELPDLSTDLGGRDVLTNSRVRCFQTCRRKHYLQYELGIERIDEEEREALIFGTTLHEAMEQYFLNLKSQQERH